ncbi:MAG TPA: penicillin-insensitive murein endopeptidase [Xanthobacteraceae bacterium]|nr:penicillin-insensitive murein endopeptidase [Xanthobacteraceae bacterium]
MRIRLTVAALLLGAAGAAAQTPSAPIPPQKPAAAAAVTTAIIPNKPARELFGSKAEPAALPARSIGFYAHGCLAGAMALPVDGQTWQVMRLSRNRNWGHPDLIQFLERFSAKLPEIAGWRGIMVGDLSQPRGGPMLSGHASHQVGLDADIWLTPMPKRNLTAEERETITPLMMVRDDRTDIDPKNWTPSHLKVIKAAAEDPAVERIFVNAAIKKALCREAGGDRAWLDKVRAYWGHDYHMHVRIKCPAGSTECEKQAPVPAGDGCGKELDYWFQWSVLHPIPPLIPPKPKPGPSMADLPAACRQVLLAP